MWPEMRLVPAVTSLNMMDSMVLQKILLQFSCCFSAASKTLYSPETFTCDFSCIFLFNIAYKPVLHCQKIVFEYDPTFD